MEKQNKCNTPQIMREENRNNLHSNEVLFTCPYCEAKGVYFNDNFCYNCGKKLEWEL